MAALGTVDADLAALSVDLAAAPSGVEIGFAPVPTRRF
jgi:hypothetical protein